MPRNHTIERIIGSPPGGILARVPGALGACFMLFMLGCPNAWPAEIDSVTPRNIRLENSLGLINEIFNQRIAEGIEKANAHRDAPGDTDDIDFFTQHKDCDETVLYEEIRKAVYRSHTLFWGLKGYDIDTQLRDLMARQSYSLSLKDSIYRDIDYLEGVSLNLKELSDVVNINGHLVGLDKPGHFFAEGWQYFEITVDEDRDIYDALEWGKQQEAGLFGYTTTGIFSYADLVANFNGWRFWNKVLLRQGDPVKGFIGRLFDRPYASCDIQFIESIKNRKIVRAWEHNADFDLSQFVDGAWDEGNNCNSYADPLIEAKVTSRIGQVDPGFSCPLHPGYCVAAREKYGEYAKYILHPLCMIANAK